MIVRNPKDPEVLATLYRAHGGAWATMILDQRHLSQLGFLAHAILDPGHRIEPHRDPMEEIYIVIQGRGRMQVDTEVREVSTGDAVAIPVGALHGLENVGEERLKILVVAARW